jgi:hypothetical protein
VNEGRESAVPSLSLGLRSEDQPDFREATAHRPGLGAGERFVRPVIIVYVPIVIGLLLLAFCLLQQAFVRSRRA